MKTVGIVCEGPRDFDLLSAVIDHITGTGNTYLSLQPEPDANGVLGNGWKGVWRWCEQNGPVLKNLIFGVEPQIDLLVLQMDGDVSRKEQESHCRCNPLLCPKSGLIAPLKCPDKIDRKCPVVLPCAAHPDGPDGCVIHLRTLIQSLLGGTTDLPLCITIPCDSTDAWIIAAYDQPPNCEQVADPWEHVICHGKLYHGIRVKVKKSAAVYRSMIPTVCRQWETVKTCCPQAAAFERDVLATI